jgi:hypothetical protein
MAARLEVHRQQPDLARCAGVKGDVGAPADVVLRQAELAVIGIAAIRDAWPDGEADVLHVLAPGETERPVREDACRDARTIRFLQRKNIGRYRRDEFVEPLDFGVAPAADRYQIAVDAALVPPRALALLEAAAGQFVEGFRQHQPTGVPGRQCELRVLLGCVCAGGHEHRGDDSGEKQAKSGAAVHA